MINSHNSDKASTLNTINQVSLNGEILCCGAIFCVRINDMNIILIEIKVKEADKL